MYIPWLIFRGKCLKSRKITQNPCRGVILRDWTAAFLSLYVAKQAAQVSRLLPGASPLSQARGLPEGQRPRFPAPTSLSQPANPPETNLPPTSGNCPCVSWLRWCWPLYPERAQTWLLWRQGYCRTHQHAPLHRISSARGRDLGETQGRKESQWGNWLHLCWKRNPSQEPCLPSGSWRESLSRVWRRESDPRKRQG